MTGYVECVIFELASGYIDNEHGSDMDNGNLPTGSNWKLSCKIYIGCIKCIPHSKLKNSCTIIMCVTELVSLCLPSQALDMVHKNQANLASVSRKYPVI